MEYNSKSKDENEAANAASASDQLMDVTSESLESLKVGATNLLDGTYDGKGWLLNGNNYGTFSGSQAIFNIEATRTDGAFIIRHPFIPFEHTKEYTISFQYRTEGAPRAGTSHVQIYGLTPECTENTITREFQHSTEWKEFEWTFTPQEIWENCEMSVRFYNQGTNGTDFTLFLKNIKLEKGTIPTDYSLSINDLLEMNGRLDDYLPLTGGTLTGKLTIDPKSGSTQAIETREGDYRISISNDEYKSVYHGLKFVNEPDNSSIGSVGVYGQKRTGDKFSPSYIKVGFGDSTDHAGLQINQEGHTGIGRLPAEGNHLHVAGKTEMDDDLQVKGDVKVDGQLLYNSKEVAIKEDVKEIKEAVGSPDGIAPLDENGFVPSSHLPSYVDDVLEFESLDKFPNPGETGKIYVTLDTNLTYRWSGTHYVEISKSIALGETSSTAYPGDKGKQLNEQVKKIENTLSQDYYNIPKVDSLVNEVKEGTVEAANKLSAARTIWGQWFDGTANVSGTLSNVGSIIPNTTLNGSIGSIGSRFHRLYSNAVVIAPATEGSYLYLTKLDHSNPGNIISGIRFTDYTNNTHNSLGGLYLYGYKENSTTDAEYIKLGFGDYTEDNGVFIYPENIISIGSNQKNSSYRLRVDDIDGYSVYTSGRIYAASSLLTKENVVAQGYVHSNTLTITNKEAVGHINFSRGSYNYFTVPENGSFAFCANGIAAGDSSKATLIIDGNGIRPGSNALYNVGSNTYRWNKLYAQNAEFTDTIIANTLQGKYIPTATIIPDVANTYNLGSSGYRFATIYANSLNLTANANITGNVVNNGNITTTGNIYLANSTGTVTARFSSISISRTANMDLNDYRTPGMYYATSSTAIGINVPDNTASGFSLFVERTAWGNNEDPAVKQTLTFHTPSCRTYIRTYHPTSTQQWGNWYEIYTTYNLPNIIDKYLPLSAGSSYPLTGALHVNNVIYSSNIIYGGSTIYSGGKRAADDGITGGILGNAGSLYLQGDTTAQIRFYRNSETSYNAIIQNSADGVIAFPAGTRVVIGSTTDPNVSNDAIFRVTGAAYFTGNTFVGSLNRTGTGSNIGTSGSPFASLWATSVNGVGISATGDGTKFLSDKGEYIEIPPGISEWGDLQGSPGDNTNLTTYLGNNYLKLTGGTLTGYLYSESSIYAGPSKKSTTDGNRGVILSANGHVYLTTNSTSDSNNPSIRFCRLGATTYGSILSEITNGLLCVRDKLIVGSSSTAYQGYTFTTIGQTYLGGSVNIAGKVAIDAHGVLTLANRSTPLEFSYVGANIVNVVEKGYLGFRVNGEAASTLIIESGSVRKSTQLTVSLGMSTALWDGLFTTHVNNVPIINTGDGTSYLANDGTYKSVLTDYSGIQLTSADNIDTLLTPGRYYVPSGVSNPAGTYPNGFLSSTTWTLIIYAYSDVTSVEMLFQQNNIWSRTVGTTTRQWVKVAQGDLNDYLPLSGGSSYPITGYLYTNDHVYVGKSLYTGEKKLSTDGLKGGQLGADGVLRLQAATPKIEFFAEGSTSANANLRYIPESGLMAFSSGLRIGTTTTTASSHKLLVSGSSYFGGNVEVSGILKTSSTINGATILATGDGTKYLADDGTYKTIVTSGSWSEIQGNPSDNELLVNYISSNYLPVSGGMVNGPLTTYSSMSFFNDRTYDEPNLRIGTNAGYGVIESLNNADLHLQSGGGEIRLEAPFVSIGNENTSTYVSGNLLVNDKPVLTEDKATHIIRIPFDNINFWNNSWGTIDTLEEDEIDRLITLLLENPKCIVHLYKDEEYEDHSDPDEGVIEYNYKKYEEYSTPYEVSPYYDSSYYKNNDEEEYYHSWGVTIRITYGGYEFSIDLQHEIYYSEYDGEINQDEYYDAAWSKNSFVAGSNTQLHN